MKLTSSEFLNHGDIPVRFTGEGEDISPPLEWSDVPKETRNFALICEDFDAKDSANRNFVHWAIFNISENVSLLPEGIPADPELELPVIAMQGENSFGKIGYGGPMPPRGSGRHRYVFNLYALRKEIEVKPGANMITISQALLPELILATANLTGNYERRARKHHESMASTAGR